MNSINSVYPVRTATINGQKSKVYKIGIRFNQTETVLIFKTLFQSYIIKDIITIRSYIFGKKNTFASVMDEMKPHYSNIINKWIDYFVYL